MLYKDVLAFKPYQIQAGSPLEASTGCRQAVCVGQVTASQKALSDFPQVLEGLFCNWALQCYTQS